MATSYSQNIAAAQAKAQKQKDTQARATNYSGNIPRLNAHSQTRVLDYAMKIIEKRNQFTALFDKMDAIDVAYARFKKSEKEAVSSGTDVRGGDECCNVFSMDDVTPPIVISQVDSFVAYLAEVFLSGSPLFPVVSGVADRHWAEMLETILDDHSILGGYVRQLLLFLRDAVKYNMSAIEVDWTSIEQFSLIMDVTAAEGKTLNKKPKKFNALKRLNPRNTVWDYSVMPGDVAQNGDYAGYLERVTATRLKRLLNKWSIENKAMNVESIMACGAASYGAGTTGTFREDPIISNYGTLSQKMTGAPDWDHWFDPTAPGKRGPSSPGVMYEIFWLYARIMPANFGIVAPQPNTPQIWKFAIINGRYIGCAERIVSAYDYLPILFGQPQEDGLGYQTQSVAEAEIPFQDVANTLFNIRIAASRRAVSDRALYIADMIKPSDINNPTAAPKIPVHISQLSNKGIQDAYHQIPFDMRGTETTIQDVATIIGFSKDLHGVNGPRQGQFQKGNKSVQEWQDTMGGSDGRMRLPAMILEHQVFSPMKSIMVLNLFQYGEDAKVISQASGKQFDVDIAKLRTQTLSFRVADGFTPKSKLASTDVITGGMQLISQSPILQQAFGAMLPSMFLHMMSLQGVKGMEQYDPRNVQQTTLPGNLPVNDPRLADGANASAAIPAPVGAAAAVPPVQPGSPVDASAALNIN
jgi:hypothetical protein